METPDPDLTICETDELQSRVKYLVNELDLKIKETGPILEKIGWLRNEIRIIADELARRGKNA